MDKSLSIGIHAPGVDVAGLQSGQAYAEFFQTVESSGFDAIWVEDRVLHPAPLADSLVLLSWAAANTRHLLLGTAVGPLLDTNYIVNSYIVTWNTEGVEGLDELKAWMGENNPDLPISDAYIIGWTEAMAAHQVLEQAAANGDLTRAGVIAAFNEVTVDYKGLAPNQSWGGDANDTVVRETYSYDVVLADYDDGATIADGGGTGTALLRGPWVSDITKAQTYDGACFKTGG